MVALFRRFSLVLPLALAVALPYLLTSDSTKAFRDSARGWFAAGKGGASPVEGITDPEVGRLLSATQQYGGPSSPQTASIAPVTALEGVLRFDILPRWVMETWPHVSATGTDGQLDGLRVPLVTGTRPHDVVGSLTYYFDKNQQVQRISLDGVVGDDRYLVSVVTRVFQLQPEQLGGIGLYLSKWNGKPTSALLIRRLPVISAENPLQKLEIALELNRPRNYFGLSPEFQARLGQTLASPIPSTSMR